MNKDVFKRILPVLVFILFLIPMTTSSLLDLKQKIENEKILVEKRAQKKAEEDAKLKIYLMGKFNPSEREDFAVIPDEFNIGGYKMYLRKETLSAFMDMRNAAVKNNVDLKIASATRNFDYQKNIWNNKWTGYTLVDGKNLSKSIPDGRARFQKILEYSAVPGTSRHHFGTDIDINNANLEYFETENGRRVYEWLAINAPSFGFCQVYNQKNNKRVNGYNEEKWHWSYLPLARTFPQEYKNLIKNEDIKGFLGEEYAQSLDLLNNYVLSINPECL